ncbi:TrmB family transcriptional regulator [Bacillus pseudomycoides]|uniref:TrmB family transcriptional regulator n=1 Tax=Bacillus pseudomycoides TaxID=64104 RepID=A0AA91VDA7_9BACI|nr:MULTISPECIES: helix-turn-helix domain-containing protein [Bacillus]PEB50825.1 TrmB family transcriptional regulator [Bacillus sp. AFS098217]PED82972.1 TrmB family transcriptional regulator [Bacillus pseudomycoides]PEU06159.1 TrmB family transcriptional regulator [Bacillus sp. AFS019443]PEU20110.1 TrmB family transcriptional regulator [Bacillus sp. AFS014408]PFW62517.1 TrmB family transcriptional regulator [Bacillus sp. AFS075034]
MDEVMKELQKLGFSQYECKAYIGLLKHYPATGYEISKQTGVPRSMIYEVLGKLMDKGAVHLVPSEPVKYVPVSATELMDRMRKDFEKSFDFLDQKLNSLEQERQVDVISHIRTDERIIKEIRNMIERAEEELWISVWEQQVTELESSIQRKEQEGVHIFSILFGAPNTKIGTTFHHNYMTPDVVKERMGGHLTVIARDGKEVLIANFSDHGTSWAVTTYDPALVLVATEYVRHDIMVEEITKEFGPDKLDKLWRGNIDLVHVVTGKRSMKEMKEEG